MEQNELERIDSTRQETSVESPSLLNFNESVVEEDCDKSYMTENGICIIPCG